MKLLIFFPYFSLEVFFKDRDRRDWTIVSITDFLKSGWPALWQYLRGHLHQEFAIGRPKVETVEAKYFLKLITICARAKQRYFVNNEGRVYPIHAGRVLLLETPKILLEMLLDFIIIVLSYIGLGFLWLFFRVTQKRRFKAVTEQHVAFCRTDNFGQITSGGSVTHVQGFYRGMQHHGWSLEFLAPYPPFHLDAKTEFRRIPYPSFFEVPELPAIWYGFRFLVWAYRMLRKKKLAFLYHRHSAFHASSPLLARLLHIPVILEYNGSEAWVKEKWGRLFLRNLCYFFERVALLGADKIAVVSDVLKDELKSRGVPEEKIIQNVNGVDPKQFHPEVDGSLVKKQYQLDGKTVIGFIGSFGPWHGIDVLAQAILPALKENPSLHFLIMGDGALRGYLEKKIHEDGVAEHVTITGSIPHEQSPQYLAACDILVSPHVANADGTRFFGSPTKLFEYMAMAKPIVASNLEQIGKVLEHKKTAWLVSPGNVADFVEGLTRLVHEKELAKQLGRAAREKVLLAYTWDHNAKRILQAHATMRSA